VTTATANPVVRRVRRRLRRLEQRLAGRGLRLTRRLSVRLLGVFFLTSIIYGLGSFYAVRFVRQTDYTRELVGSHIALHADLVLRAIGSPPDPRRAQAIVDRVPVDIRISGPGLDWMSDARFPDLNTIPFGPIDFLDLDERSLKEIEAWARSLDRVRFANYKGHLYAELRNDDYSVVFASPRLAETPPPDLTGIALIVTSILVLTGCYFTVRWLIKPIGWIQEGAARIGEGDLDYRIPTTRKDDLGELALDINHMADDVRDMLEAKQQLLLAISHELRSPLTRAKVALEFLDESQVRQDLLGDIREMEKLIADLLETERMNTGHTTLQRSAVDLKAMLESVIGTEFGDQPGRVALTLPTQPVTRQVDAIRLRLVAKNLIENALRYNPEGGEPVAVELRVVPGAVALSVRDHGPGIAREALARVTEPFFRADPARSRTTGGFGLGLYLCRRIAEAHRGTLAIDSEPGRGTVATVTIPDFDAPAAA
jgi:signal transduction histidine kinase